MPKKSQVCGKRTIGRSVISGICFKFGFAKLIGDAGYFDSDCDHLETSLCPPPARKRPLRGPRDQPHIGPFGPRDPAVMGPGRLAGEHNREPIGRSISAAQSRILVSKSSAIQANTASIANKFGDGQADYQPHHILWQPNSAQSKIQQLISDQPNKKSPIFNQPHIWVAFYQRA